MRINKVSEVQEDDVKIVVREINKNEVKTTENNTKEPQTNTPVKRERGRPFLAKKDVATEKVTIFFTQEEIVKIEMLMNLEGIDTTKKNGRALYLRKAITKEMFRNGISF